jgi:TetR/AcrR family transcriptional regulator, cholesterol catabolism regulator
MDEKDVKDKILTGARDLFLKYGVRSVSMDDIARQLVVSKKTIYQYFADKDEIVTQVAQQHLEDDRCEFDKVVSKAKNALDELVRMSLHLRKRMQDLNPALLFDLQKFHSKAWNEWTEYRKSFVHQQVMRNIKQGMEEGLFRSDLNPEILAAMRIEMVQLAFNTDVFSPAQFKLHEVHMQLFDHFIYGLLTEKGRKLYEKYKQEPNNLELTPYHA